MTVRSGAYRVMPRACLGDDTLSIRAIREEDIESVRLWRNAQMDVLRQSEPISSEAQVRYFTEKVWPEQALREPAQVLLAIERQGVLIGYGGLVHIAWVHRRAEVSFLLDPSRTTDLTRYRSDFLAFLQLVKTLAFDDLKLQRLYTETYAIRQHHLSVLEAADFRLEGTLRQHVIIDGRPVDSLFHGCLDSYAR